MSATVVHGRSPARAPSPLPPGPRGIALAPALRALARDPWRFTGWVARQYGDVARLPVPFAEVILLSHPDGIAHVNLKAPDRYERSPMVTESMRVQGSRATTRPGSTTTTTSWARGRKLLQPHFTQKALSELGTLFTEADHG